MTQIVHPGAKAISPSKWQCLKVTFTVTFERQDIRIRHKINPSNTLRLHIGFHMFQNSVLRNFKNQNLSLLGVTRSIAPVYRLASQHLPNQRKLPWRAKQTCLPKIETGITPLCTATAKFPVRDNCHSFDAFCQKIVKVNILNKWHCPLWWSALTKTC